jgi:transcriptional antiterminator RfaH
MNIELADDALRWYVIQTQPRQEQRAEDNLRAWMVETFFPKLKEARYNRYTGQRADVVKPLFPSYIFARFQARYLLHKVHFTRGVSKVVNFGSGPASIDDEALSIIKENLHEDGCVRLQDDLKAGDKVIIKDGPLKDFSGIFEREMSASDRVSILLSTATYQGHLVVDRRFVAKVRS